MLAERLAALGAIDAAPAWHELVEAVPDVGAEIDQLPAALLSVLTEALIDSWDTIGLDQRELVVRCAVGRLSALEDPLSFASVLDRLTPAAVAVGPGAVDALQQTCATLVQARVDLGTAHELPAGAIRARFALAAWADLVCANATTSYRFMADLEELRKMMPPDLAAPAARAAGRVAEQLDDPLLEEVMRAALEVEDAVGDACVELGHHAVRSAARAGSLDEAAAVLRSALELYGDAASSEELRPDATAYAAAVELTLGFLAGATADALAEPSDRMVSAARELRAHLDDGAPSRPMDHLAAWLTLGARLRGAAERMEGRGLLDLRAGLLALLDLYADSRLRVLGETDVSADLQIVIGPRIEHWIATNPVPRDALVALQVELGEASPLHGPVGNLLEVTEEPGKASRSRFQPGLPGCWALDNCPPETRTPPIAP